MGLADRYVAPMLSHHRMGAGKEIFNSRRRELIQISSDDALATALYSASMLERATVGCFFELQEMRLLPRNTRNPPVDRRSNELPAESASLYAVSDISESRLKWSP